MRSTVSAPPEAPEATSRPASATPWSSSPTCCRSRPGWSHRRPSRRAATFRPEVTIEGRPTRVLAEQTTAVDPQRLGESAGQLSFDELRQVDAALRLVLAL